MVSGKSLIAHVRRQTAWAIRSAGVMDGCVRYAWRKYTVSEMYNVFVTASTPSLH